MSETMICKCGADKGVCVDCLQDDYNRLLNAVKAAYRKHHLGDDSIRWDELDNMLFNALTDTLSDKGFCKWLKGLDLDLPTKKPFQV